MKGSMAMSETDVMSDTPIVTQPSQQSNYWGFQDTFKYLFPDGVTFIEFRVMNEGDRVKFQSKTSRDVVLNRQGDARMKVDTGADRHELIKSCATGWNLIKGEGELIPFNERILQQWLNVADPKLVESIELEVRKHNPWLLGEMSSADIRKEIENLEEMLKLAEEREAGESSSGSR